MPIGAKESCATLPIGKETATEHAGENRAWPFADRLGSVFVRDPSRRWKETEAGHVVVSGQLRLRNHAGVLDLRTPYDMPLMAEVVCGKLDYIDEFQTLLNEVAEQLAELLLQYDSPLSVAFDIAASAVSVHDIPGSHSFTSSSLKGTGLLPEFIKSRSAPPR